MIVKVQKTLFSNGQPRILVYNRDRSVYVQWPIPEDLEQKLEGDHRAYFRAEVTRDQTIHIFERVSSPRW